MTYGKASVVVGREGAVDRCAGAVVVPDGCGEGQDVLQNAHENTGGVCAVSFEVELAFEGRVDRFDVLAQGLEQVCSGAFGLAFAGGRSRHWCWAAGRLRVRRRSAAGRRSGSARAGRRPGRAGRQAAEGGDRVQAQDPEVARVAGAVAVRRPAGQVAAVCGVAGAAAFHRGGVGDPHIIVVQADAGGERPGHRRAQPGGGAQLRL
jgi:hypothetical protein